MRVLAGLDCGDGQFCNFDIDASCGFADASGVCAAKPEVCIELYAPVCGCDGQTYGNACFANAAGTSVAADGECKTFCGGFGNIACPDGKVCVRRSR